MLLIKLVFKDTNIFIIKKSAKKGLINDYSYRVISSISCLQDTSSEVIKSNIQFNSISMYLSNLTTMSDIYSFGTGPSTSSNSNQINHQKGSIFIGDNNFKKNILMRHILQQKLLILSYMRVLLLIFLKNLVKDGIVFDNKRIKRLQSSKQKFHFQGSVVCYLWPEHAKEIQYD